jgi:hypothetical protein
MKRARHIPIPGPLGRRPLYALLAFAFVGAGCGGQSSQRLPAADASVLAGRLSAAQAAAGRGDRASTLADLTGFVATARRLAAAGRLSPEDARALAAGGGQALAVAARSLPLPAVTPVAAPATQSQAAPPQPAVAGGPAGSKGSEDGGRPKRVKRHHHGHHGQQGPLAPEVVGGPGEQ